MAAAASGIPKSTFHRKVKEGTTIHAHSKAVKPYLTEENMRTQVACCLNQIDVTHQIIHEMKGVVNILEKWVYLFEMEWKNWFGEGEWEPYLRVKLKCL